MTGSCAVCQGRFTTPDSLKGRSHIWHETYLLLHTKILRFAAFRVTSKRLEIGPGEHAWSDVKQVKDSTRSNLCNDFLEKRTILFTTAHDGMSERAGNFEKFFPHSYDCLLYLNS